MSYTLYDISDRASNQADAETAAAQPQVNAESSQGVTL
ncbi:hypothetical protein JCM19233_2861 [Vibrio astriarenae]|nr:hypothetical protein JCM19233_2861 [Vibrio sp. C7]